LGVINPGTRIVNPTTPKTRPVRKVRVTEAEHARILALAAELKRAGRK
jgi:hypothetical protein